jgi:hypothetical protein
VTSAVQPLPMRTNHRRERNRPSRLRSSPNRMLVATVLIVRCEPCCLGNL